MSTFFISTLQLVTRPDLPPNTELRRTSLLILPSNIAVNKFGKVFSETDNKTDQEAKEEEEERLERVYQYNWKRIS